jgi:hypothetical protein
MAAIVYGWSEQQVVKADSVVQSQLAINKSWLPDDVLNIIKDFLYISASDVIRNFYKSSITINILRIETNFGYLSDVRGRPRIAHWMTGHVDEFQGIQLQGMTCVTCGNPSEHHETLTGCCVFHDEGEIDGEIDIRSDYDWETQVYPTGWFADDDFAAAAPEELTLEELEPEMIPEVSWAIDIPAAAADSDEESYYNSDDGYDSEDYIRASDKRGAYSRGGRS